MQYIIQKTQELLSVAIYSTFHPTHRRSLSKASSVDLELLLIVIKLVPNSS